MGFRREKIDEYFLLDTSVENIFINEYMATAPGSYVKVYLFASMYAELDVDISNDEIARQLSVERGDVLRAWDHWEKMGIVRKIYKNNEAGSDYDIEFNVLKKQLYGSDETSKYAGAEETGHSVMADKAMRKMFNDIENLTGNVMNGSEMMEILSWVNDFGATPELIVRCYEYCLEKNKKNIKYIGAVVKDWVGRGLKDAASVNRHLRETERKYRVYDRIAKAMGFYRNITEGERELIDKWIDEQGFSVERILSACKQTTGINNPNLNYLDKVLTDRYEREKRGERTNHREIKTSEIKQYYDILQKKAEREAEERKKEVFDKEPRISEIEKELKERSMKLSSLILSDVNDKQKIIEGIHESIEKLNAEKAFLLTDNGFEIDYMEKKYICSECRDTGQLETGEKCKCVEGITREKLQEARSL